MTSLIERLPDIRGTYRPTANLSKVNWFNVGGNAEILYRPADREDLCHFLRHKPADIPVTILGVGSNLLVRDGGIDGVVIKLGRGFVDMALHGNILHAGAGALSFNVSLYAQQHQRQGLEFLTGIPGTIGGALAMNAGCYQSDIATVLHQAEAIDEGGNIHILSPKDIGYIYRGHTLPEGYIFTKALFHTTAGEGEKIQQHMHEITQQRESTQPIRSRTSGSTFRNPEGHKAWELIDNAGCRGLTIGGAKISEKHCNFLINTGGATAHDLEQLGEEVRRRVKAHCGIELHWEIKRIGKSTDS